MVSLINSLHALARSQSLLFLVNTEIQIVHCALKIPYEIVAEVQNFHEPYVFEVFYRRI